VRYWKQTLSDAQVYNEFMGGPLLTSNLLVNYEQTSYSSSSVLDEANAQHLSLFSTSTFAEPLHAIVVRCDAIMPFDGLFSPPVNISLSAFVPSSPANQLITLHVFVPGVANISVNDLVGRPVGAGSSTETAVIIFTPSTYFFFLFDFVLTSFSAFIP
jgi:hypothetical protein